jgi:hypothetical protein
MMMSRARASHQILVLPAMLVINKQLQCVQRRRLFSREVYKKCSPVLVPHSHWRAHLVIMRRSATFA